MYATLPLGCTDSEAFNYNASANTDDGSCIAVVNGCTDSTAFNYNASANTDDGSCIAVVNGCTDSTAFNYNTSANTDDDSCIEVVNGCIDSTAFNYNASANTDDGSCIAVLNGCTDSTAFNYNASANTDDGSCIAIIIGCMDELSCTFDTSHNVDNQELCEYPDEYYNCEGNCLNDSDGDSICDQLEVDGCTDSLACDGYNPNASDDDGSCLYNDSCGVCNGLNECALFISADIIISIDQSLVENSDAIEVFEDNFEDLMETQLGLPEGSIEVLDVIIGGVSSVGLRADVDVEVICKLPLLQKRLKNQILILVAR